MPLVIWTTRSLLWLGIARLTLASTMCSLSDSIFFILCEVRPLFTPVAEARNLYAVSLLTKSHMNYLHTDFTFFPLHVTFL